MIKDLICETDTHITEILKITYPKGINNSIIINFKKKDKLTNIELNGTFIYKLMGVYDMINKVELFDRLDKIYVGRLPHSLFFRYTYKDYVISIVAYQDGEIVNLNIELDNIILKTVSTKNINIGKFSDMQCSDYKSIKNYIFENVVCNLV